MATLLAYICMAVSGAFWFPAQWDLTSPTKGTEQLIAIAMGAFMVIGPPVITSLFVPWSRVGRLLAKLHLTPLGWVLGTAVGAFLLYYAYLLTSAFWASRPLIQAAGLEFIQTVVGLIATIAVPALLWVPIGRDELEDKIATDTMIQDYEDAQKARLRDLQLKELETYRLANIGFAHITSGQAEFLAGHQLNLVKRMDELMIGLANDAEAVAGSRQRYSHILDVDPNAVDTLNWITDSLRNIAGHRGPTSDDNVSQRASTGADDSDSIREVGARSEASENVGARYGDNAQSDLGSSRITQPDRISHESFVAVREHFKDNWFTPQAVARLLDCEENTARRMISEWSQKGIEWVVPTGMRGRWRVQKSDGQVQR